MQAKVNFTAVFEQVEDGFIAYIEELPGVNSQGDTVEEARTNLLDALELFLETRREMAEEEQASKKVIKEPIKLVA